MKTGPRPANLQFSISRSLQKYGSELQNFIRPGTRFFLAFSNVGNPHGCIDPTGEEIYSANLNAAEKQKLIGDWKAKTGYQTIYFDKITNLSLTSQQVLKRGSADARRLLLDAATTADKRFDISSVHSDKVGFAHVDAGTKTQDSTGKQIGPVVYTLVYIAASRGVALRGQLKSKTRAGPVTANRYAGRVE